MQTRLELYQLVAPLAGLGIWEQHLRTGAIYWNSIVRQILEVQPNYVPGPNALSQFCKEPKYVRRLIKTLIDSKQPQQVELELITGKGNRKWVKIRMDIRSSQGLDELIYGTLEDISQDVELRKVTLEREQRFSNAFGHAPIGMALVSLSGAWIKVNKSLCTLLGYKEKELANKTFQELTHPQDLEIDLGHLRNLVDGKIDTYSMEKRYLHKDGRIIWALLNVSLVKDNAGLPLYFVSQIKDITLRRENAETIKAQNARLLNFAHIVSHNLRSHAGNIRMLSSMAITEQDDQERATQLGMLNENADTLLETLEQLNQIVKIREKDMDSRQSLPLGKHIRRAVQILSASIISEKVKVEIKVPQGTKVLFDPSYLESVFVNLLTNSIRYKHAERPPYITISARKSLDTLIIKIADNGIGIDMGLHGHKLFGMYKTFHGNADARGMGLFLVKNQVEAMGGIIYAESIPNLGTTFTIELNKQ